MKLILRRNSIHGVMAMSSRERSTARAACARRREKRNPRKLGPRNSSSRCIRPLEPQRCTSTNAFRYELQLGPSSVVILETAKFKFSLSEIATSFLAEVFPSFSSTSASLFHHFITHLQNMSLSPDTSDPSVLDPSKRITPSLEADEKDVISRGAHVAWSAASAGW